MKTHITQCYVRIAALWLFLTFLPFAKAAMPGVMLAEHYRADIDPSGYWISEKLDGVRALWDGETLYFRSGQPIAAPGWFLEGLPPIALDGELWIARGRFDELSGIIRQKNPDDQAWRQVRYMIFDLPCSKDDFSSRVRQIEQLVSQTDTPWLQFISQFRVKDTSELMRIYTALVTDGAEGVMLHRAEAFRVSGRSRELLKLTPWQDAEARIIAHIPGKGRLVGMMGALLVEDANGRQFRIGAGFTDAERRNPPPVGAWVTYRYRELTRRGVPRFPRYFRVRDLP